MSEHLPFLRHFLAVIAYRAGGCIRDAPAGFGTVRSHPSAWSASQTLAHMGDLLDWTLRLSRGEENVHMVPSGSWNEEVARFYGILAELDAFFAQTEEVRVDALRLLQGPLADVMTHIGQLAALRRIAGSPVPGQNYFAALVEIGRVGLG